MPLRSLRLSLALLSTVLLAGPTSAADSAPAPASDLLLVLDASGSMWGRVGGEPKIAVARRVLRELAADLPDGSQAGLVAYGHRREGDCADIEEVLPLAPLDREALVSRVESIQPKGKTPITASIERAVEAVRGRERPATIVLLSDGLETCGGDPCAAVRQAREAGAHFLLHVIGFDLAEQDVAQLECAAQAGGGLYFDARDAGELASALDRAVAAPAPEEPARASALSVRAVRNGEPADVLVAVTDAATGEPAAGGRTYTGPETNPRIFPLPAGTYDVRVEPVKLPGAAPRTFASVEIPEGETVERRVDYSSGTLAVGVTRNGALSDATVKVLPVEGDRAVAGGRTYTAASSNPKTIELPAGVYDVEIASVEVEGGPAHRWDDVAVEPGARTELAHDFTTGELRIGARRAGAPVDATVKVLPAEGGRPVAGGRTYTGPKTNPRAFTLPPGRYRVVVAPVRGEGGERELTVEVPAGSSVERQVDF